MRKMFIVLIVCLVYFGISVATSKTVEFPFDCPKFYDYLRDDTTNLCQLTANDRYYPHRIDTIILRISDTNFVIQKATEICSTLKDSCGFANSVLIFFDTSYSINYDTTLKIGGKRIYTTKCP